MAKYALLAGVLGAAAFIGLAAPSPALAVSVTWNTCDGDRENPSNSGPFDCEIDVPSPGADLVLVESPRVHTDPPGDNNNSFTFTEVVDAEARVLIAKAFRTDNVSGGPATTAILPATISLFEGGLGVHSHTNGADEENTGSPNHAVDNIGYDELVLFEFADPNYEPLSFMTGWNCNFGTDNDSSCEYGSFSSIITLIGSGDILGAFLALLQTGDPGAGFTAELFNDVNIGELQSFSSGAQGQFLIIAAAAGLHTERVSQQTPFSYTGSDAPYDTSGERNAKCVALHGAGATASNYSSSSNSFKCNYKVNVDKDGSNAFKLAQVSGALVAQVPEPALVGLLGLVMLGLGSVVRRRVGG